MLLLLFAAAAMLPMFTRVDMPLDAAAMRHGECRELRDDDATPLHMALLILMLSPMPRRHAMPPLRYRQAIHTPADAAAAMPHVYFRYAAAFAALLMTLMLLYMADIRCCRRRCCRRRFRCRFDIFYATLDAAAAAAAADAIIFVARLLISPACFTMPFFSTPLCQLATITLSPCQNIANGTVVRRLPPPACLY